MEVDETNKNVMADPAAVGSISQSLHPLVLKNISEHCTRVRAEEGFAQQNFNRDVEPAEVVKEVVKDPVLVNSSSGPSNSAGLSVNSSSGDKLNTNRAVAGSTEGASKRARRLRKRSWSRSNPGVNFISYLPIGILEEIFLYLDCKDLMRCSYVCVQWREVVNSNKIWALQCSKERILHKEYLQTSQSFISNPLMQYGDRKFDPKTTRLTVPCHWRSHYNRYKFLERNWRKGHFSMRRNEVNAEFYNDGLLIGMENNGIAVYSIHNLQAPMYIKKQYPSINIDAVRVKGNLLFYTQGSHLICTKRNNITFTIQYEIAVPSYLNLHTHRVTTEPKLDVKITDKFLITQNLTCSCFLHFYDYETGEPLKTVKLHKFTGDRCPEVTGLEAFDDKVFVAYRLVFVAYVLIYDFKADKVNFKVTTSLRSSDLVVSKNFFCSKLSDNENNDRSCNLHVWSTNTGVEVALLRTNRHVPVLITDDDKLIFSEHSTIYVRGLVDSSKNAEFVVEGHLQNMEYVRGNLLVVNVSFSLQLWDLTSSQKMQTYLRENIQDMWVDDRHIVVRLSNRPWVTGSGCIIGFW